MSKSESKSRKTTTQNTETSNSAKKRGRPKKERTPEELAKIEENKKNKLSLEQKQELKLKIQKQREAAKIKQGKPVQDNSDRCYCKNKDLHAELLKWRNSDPKGVRVQKLVGDKLVNTELNDTQEGHEKYVEGMRYFVRISKFNDDEWKESFDDDGKPEKLFIKGHNTKLLEKAKEQLEDEHQEKFYKETKDYITHEITHQVRKEGWAFNFDVVEDRVINELIGQMMLKIGKKLTNHSNFRNYTPELKEDMVFFGIQKLIKGLKNYNFKFSNPFAWMTQGFFNSFLTTIYHHYKQMNIRRDLMKKLSTEIETFNGMDPRSSLNKAIKQYLGEEFDIDD